MKLQLETARTAETELQASADRLRLAEEEMKRLRDSNSELLRLRNQVRMLQGEKETIAKQAQASQAQLERSQTQTHAQMQALKAQAEAAQASAAAMQTNSLGAARARFAQRYGLTPTPDGAPAQAAEQAATQGAEQTAAQASGCANALLLIEAAKAQWALENNKLPGASVTMADLAPYMNGAIACPGGGTYQLNPIGVRATCSIVAHQTAR